MITANHNVLPIKRQSATANPSIQSAMEAVRASVGQCQNHPANPWLLSEYSQRTCPSAFDHSKWQLNRWLSRTLITSPNVVAPTQAGRRRNKADGEISRFSGTEARTRHRGAGRRSELDRGGGMHLRMGAGTGT